MADPFTIFLIATAIFSGGASYVQAKKAQKLAKKAAKAGQGLLINSEGTNNFIPVIYGTRRIAGTRVFVATNDIVGGDPNEFLYLVYVLCEGEVDDVTEILIDDLPVTDPRFAYTDSIAINIYKGTDAQTADTRFTSAGIGWTADHTLKGLCYITVRLKWNSDAFSDIPNITALVRGKKVYDPRIASTAYSTNPALCIRDYLTNDRYGKGLDSSLIDDTLFNSAATFYETTAEFWPSGTVGNLFDFNAVIDTEKNILENLKDMLLCCRGFLPYTNGVYQLIPDKSAASSFAFTTDNIINGIAFRGESKEDKYNKVIITFTDPENNWQENTAIWPDAGSAEEIAYLAEDNDVELVGDFDLPCITNYYAARDLARVYLLRSRNALRCSFDANSDALNLTVGDVVTVTHPTPAWSAKPFQVEEISINYDGTCRVALLEYDSTIYAYDPASEQLAYADTDLPNPFSLAAPTGITITETTYLNSDGTVIPEIKVEWTPPADAFVDFYELQFKRTTDSDWSSVVTPEPFYVEDFAEVGDSYNVRVRAVNTLGVRSAWATTTYTILGDIAGPEKAIGLTIIGDVTRAEVKWTACTAKDYKETLLWASLTDDFATATIQARIAGTSVAYTGLPENTTYYVWAQHLDFSGNPGTVSDREIFSTSRGTIDPPTSLSVSLSSYIAPTGDGTAVPIVRVSWTAPAQAVQYYDLQYKETSLSDWFSVSVPTTFFEANNAKVGISYDVRVRAVNDNFGKSTYLTGTFTPIKDATAPATPTGLTITGDYNQAVLKWTAATEKDYKHTLIYASTTNNSATAPLAATVSGNSVTVAGLPVSTTYYVWLKNEDFSGNISGFSTVVSFNTTTGAAASSVVAGGTIAGSATTDGVQISTVRTNAASGKSISDTLLVSGEAVLKGVIQPDNTGGIRTGPVGNPISWNSTTGALTGGTGVAITEWGIIGAASGVATFSIEAATGDAIFKGNITGATGTFSGDLNTAGQVKGTGSTSGGALGNASVLGAPSSSSVKGVLGISTNNAGIQGYSETSYGGYFSNNASSTEPLYATQLGSATFVARFVGNAITTGNSVIGSATNTGTNNLIIKEGSAGTRLDDQILLYGALSSTSDTTVGIVTEQDVVEGTNEFSGISQIRVWWNGVEYWLPLRAV